MRHWPPAALLAVFFCTCAPGGLSPGQAGNAGTGTTYVEVRDYEGEKLGSIGDFRENSIRGPQEVDSAGYRLTVDGLVRDSLSWSLDRLLALPTHKRVVTIYCVEGWEVKLLWEGFRIAELLDSAGADSTARTVVFHAVDGYTSSLPLEFVRGRDLLLAHRMNDAVLPPERGYPLQLVAEDKWGYKWVKWVDRVELVADTSYRGFWEERGYNNDGSVKGPVREPGYRRPGR